MTEWDPDGAGPRQPILVLGGTFKMAGTALSANIAAWDGAQWLALGSGIGQGEQLTVWRLTTHQGNLVAVTSAGTGDQGPSSVYVWNGTTWQYLPGTLGIVETILEFNGELIVGGATPSPVGLRRYVGGQWQQFGPAGVSAKKLVVMNGELVAMGKFPTTSGGTVNDVRRFNGADWVPLGAGLTTQLDTSSTMRSFGGDLYAVGSFVVGGTSCSVVHWNGTAWTSMGTPAFSVGWGADIEMFGGIPHVTIGVACSRWNGNGWVRVGDDTVFGNYALAVFQNELFVCGHFPRIGNTYAKYIAKWSGTAWLPISAGIAGPTQSFPDPILVYATKEYAGELVAGGFYSRIGDIHTSSIARWDGTTWRSLGTGLAGHVYALGEFQGELIAAGTFFFAGGVNASNIARWDGTNWHSLGTGGVGAVSQIAVLAMCTYHGDLYVGGYVSQAGSVPVRYLARWNGSDWSEAAGGTNGPVLAMAEYQGKLVVAGSFTQAGGIGASNIAAWDGDQWTTLGDGWTNGGSARPVRLIEHRGELILGSQFVTAAGVPTNSIAAWNGTAWHPLGEGPGFNIFSLASYKGVLIAGGARSPLSVGAARWNGATWDALGAGVGGGYAGVCAYAMTPFRDTLFVGGDFLTAGGQGSACWARWTDGTPTFASSPQGGEPCVGSAQVLEVALYSTTSQASYEWFRNDLALQNGGRVSGATTSSLRVSAIIGADAGTYVCRVTNACGAGESDPAVLRVCVADFDCDGVVRVQDIYDFIAAWFGGESRADIDVSGFLSGLDVLAFVDAWFAGCP